MALLAAHETQGLLLVALLIFCETGLVILPFLPGDSILFALGAFAALNNKSPLLPIAVLSAAAIAGDGVNYFLGGSSLGQWIERRGWISAAHLQQTRDYFNRLAVDRHDWSLRARCSHHRPVCCWSRKHAR